jgi:solute carrier family 26 (sodium-independent sulfate anion transporter), member 11
MVGIYSLAMGVLGLGFLLDYVSVPVLTGFISATALIIGMGQVGNLVGLSGVPDGVFNQLGFLLKHLPDWDGPTCGIGIGTIILLLALEKIGKTWGKKHFIIKYLASSRAVIALVIFTLISYLVNKDRKDDLLWGISKVNTHGIIAPKAHNTGLISKVATRAIAPLVACTLEHLAVGKAFGRKNAYEIDESQELNYLGVTNLVNSFFGAMTVGGAMSRTAVNSECGVKSPLNGLVTSAFILLTIYVFSPALFWLPKATLSAIIVSQENK